MSLNSITEIRDNGIPKIKQGTLAYDQFWQEQFKYCRDGITCGNTKISGELYFYLNFYKISIDEKKRGTKKLGSPEFRDIEWIFFIEALEKAKIEKKGLCFLSARGIGKSFLASALILHSFTFNNNTENLVSAGEENDLNTLISKIQQGMNSLPNEFKQEQIRSNWKDEIRAGRKIKDLNGNYVTVGTNNCIWIRNYKNNTMAANGTRPKIHIFEEAGKHKNLIDCYNASRHCWLDGDKNQFSIPLIIGTGGDMEKGTADFSRIFYDPETYDLVSFELDEKEETNISVSLFIPATYAVNSMKIKYSLKEYLGEEPNDILENTYIYKSDIEETRKHIKARRDKLIKAKDDKSYNQEIQYNPFFPKEAFLSGYSNIFNKQLLNDQIINVRKKDPIQKGILEKEGNKVIWIPDSRGWLRIFEHPTEHISFGNYVAGTDPYAIDQSTYSKSLGSTFVYKPFRGNYNELYNIFVAEYTERPSTQNIYLDRLLLLLEYYNCRTLYENMITKPYDYFKLKNKLNYLAKQPNNVIKSIIQNSKVVREYGIHMISSIKQTGEMNLSDYIEENCHNIFFIDALEELIKYDNEGNFDRVIAMMLCLFHAQQVHHTRRNIYNQKESVQLPVYKFNGDELTWK